MAEPATPPAPVAAGEPKGGDPTPAGAVALDWIPETETIDLVEAGKPVQQPLRGVKTLSKFKTAADLARGYVNLERHAGGAVRIPGENATKEEVSAFREKLGVPKDPGGYGIKYDDLKVPESVKAQFDEAAFGDFLTWAHGEGYTKRQVEKTIDRFVQTVQRDTDAAAQSNSRSADAALVTLRDGKDGYPAWGSLTGRNTALVRRGVKEFFGEDFAAWLEETGAGNDPRFMRGALRTFQPMMEDGLISGENLGTSRADAAAEIKKLEASDEYKSKDRNVRLPVIERIRALSEIAFSE